MRSANGSLEVAYCVVGERFVDEHVNRRACTPATDATFRRPPLIA
jgi:hypothetical protein